MRIAELAMERERWTSRRAGSDSDQMACPQCLDLSRTYGEARVAQD